MSKQADKFPALGLPSEAGPCFVVRRVEDRVKSPAMRDTLERKVEQGKELTNPEAHLVYDREVERGPGGLIQKFEISAHAQYRMDLRGVTVPEIRLSFQRFLKDLNDWKSRRDPAYDAVARAIRSNTPIEYDDKRLGLFLVFAIPREGMAQVITVYWKGVPDPKAPGMCVVPHSHPEHRQARDPVQDWGTQTYTKTPSDNPDNREKEQVLPTPPWKHEKPQGKPEYNTPGPSNTGPGEKSLHKDRVRTVGVPGGDHPQPPARTTPVRRPEVTGELDPLEADWFDRLDPQVEEPILEAAVKGKPYPGIDRQRAQRGQAKKYYQVRYQKKRRDYKRRMQRWYRKYRRNPRYLKDQERRDEHPQRFERRPGGGVKTNKERSREWREKQKKASLEIPVFYLPLQEWGWFDGIGEEDLARVWVDGNLFEMPLDLFFDQVEGDEESASAVLSYLDEVYEFAGDEEDEMPDLDESLDALRKVAFQFRLHYRPEKRQHKQRGTQKWKSKMEYRRNRAKARRQSRIRYKRLKRLPAFKKQQQIRRQHPERFKRRLGEVLTMPEIAFVIGGDLAIGYVHHLSPMTGLVTFHRTGTERPEDSLESMPVEDFMASVGFLSEGDEEAMFKLIDVELGETAWSGELSEDGLRGSAALMEIDCDSPKFQDLCEKLVGKAKIPEMSPTEVALVNSVVVHQLVYDGESEDISDFPDRSLAGLPSQADGYMHDHTDDDYMFGRVVLDEDYSHLVRRTAHRWVARQAEMLYRKEPPQMDPDQFIDRAEDRKKHKDEDPPANTLEQPVVEENPGSAKVIPYNHPDMVNNRAASEMMARIAARIPEIVQRCSPDLVRRARGIPVRLNRVDPRNAVWLFDVRGSSGTHRVRVKALRKGNVRDAVKVHVRVSCSCPFWQWQGPEYHAKTGDYLFGRPRGTATKPTEKDPTNHHAACKHVLAVFDHITRHKWSVPPMGKQGARFLVDSLSLGEPVSAARVVAARYLVLKARGN